MNQDRLSTRGSGRSNGKQTVYVMRRGCFSSAVRTESSSCCHWLGSGTERKNLACQPHSNPSASFQKHSTPASGGALRTNVAPNGAASCAASWQHSSSKAAFCVPFHGRKFCQFKVMWIAGSNRKRGPPGWRRTNFCDSSPDAQRSQGPPDVRRTVSLQGGGR